MPRTVRLKQPRPKRIPEKSIQLEIMSALGYMGWICKRCPPSIYSAGGWCDFIAIRRGIVLWIEVKAEDGKQSPDQVRFERDIKYGGGNYILARSWADVEATIFAITGVAERKLF